MRTAAASIGELGPIRCTREEGVTITNLLETLKKVRDVFASGITKTHAKQRVNVFFFYAAALFLHTFEKGKHECSYKRSSSEVVQLLLELFSRIVLSRFQGIPNMLQ